MPAPGFPSLPPSPAGKAVALLGALLAGGPAAAEHAPGGPETLVLPKNLLFQPLLADPKRPRFFVSALDARIAGLDTIVAAVGYGGQSGLVRWARDKPWEGWQLGISGGLFAQFDANSPSEDLINADYTLGLPLTYRRGRNALRLRLYHQSSHLGDEFLLNHDVERVDFRFNALEALFARTYQAWRLYGGGEYLFDRYPRDLKPWIGHWGLEYRRAQPLLVGRRGGATYLVAGVDAKAMQENHWRVGWSLTAGLEFHHSLPEQPQDKYWSLTAVAYDGPSPYGQFFTQEVRYWGLSIEFKL